MDVTLVVSAAVIDVVVGIIIIEKKKHTIRKKF
jgi:hypothetical protein